MSDHGGPAAVVCVPARNEVERLPRLIRSLALQEGFFPTAKLRVVIVANNCSDETVNAARALATSVETAALDLRLIDVSLAPEKAHVGTARRLALDAGADWLEADGCEDGVLLTTDADARVPPDWVAANLRALRDAEIVGGRLVIAREAEPDSEHRTERWLPAFGKIRCKNEDLEHRPGYRIQDDALGLDGLHARIERYWQAVRALEDRFDPPAHDPAPRHGDHTGASLALRASLYRAVGGLPVLRRGEDNALVARVQEQGGRLRHCPAVCVHVSDRAEGRAEGGMALEMIRRAAVAGGGDVYRLPAPAHWHARLLRRAALRQSWPKVATAAGWAVLAGEIGLSDEDRAAIAPETCPNAIAFVERASRRLDTRAAPAPLLDLDAALAGFDALLGQDAA